MWSLSTQHKLALERSRKEREERAKDLEKRDRIVACGRGSFRVMRSRIQLFTKADVDQGDSEHCLQRDAYMLWKCRMVE